MPIPRYERERQNIASQRFTRGLLKLYIGCGASRPDHRRHLGDRRHSAVPSRLVGSHV